MKKVYSKPEIVFEDFSLSSSIASCEIEVEGPSQGICGYKYEGGFGQTIFTSELGTSICNMPVDDDINNGFCYYIPVDNKNLFNS